MVTVALPEKFTAFDTITSTNSDAAAERVKNLLFNSLVKKDENFDYVGELAKDIKTSEDGLSITFVLRDGVKFHNGKDLTSEDVKYTLDTLFDSKGYKAQAFYDSVPVEKPAAKKPAADNENSAAQTEAPETNQVPHITSIEVPDAKTIVIKIARPSLKTTLLSNLVTIPIIPKDSAVRQKESPLGSGPFKFISFDSGQNIVELAANADYWDGAPKIQRLRLKTITDANSLQAELQTGGVDIAPNPNNISADTIKSLSESPNLQVVQSEGSNIQYLILNVKTPVLDDVKVRQAIAYSIDRQKIVNDLLLGQAKVASSVLPTQSWAYTPGTQYNYDPAKAKQLLAEAGYKGEPIVFKFGAGNLAVSQYAQILQSSMNDVGLNIRIETMDVNVLRKKLAQGDFELYTGVWIGGNQDPIFFRELFTTAKIPGPTASCCNRGRYSNPAVDEAVTSAIETTNKEEAKQLYKKAWDLVSADVPLLPLWYPANVVVATKRVGNIHINPSGDWGFLKDVTISQ
ncbi:MAG: dipeptide ABC transporter substrate-binding protein [Acidobacteria bacterium OLB17]|nr:MAG: dipeptide ABC transporter substrate-binding protein [Acidobacteria bacterium OLB17]